MGIESRQECSTCKHWDDPDSGKFIDGIHGQCLLALIYDDIDDIARSRKPMITMDGSGYMALLFTLPDHLCRAYDGD